MSQAVLNVKIIPGSQRSEFVGWEGDALKIRIQGVPEKGKANQALIAFLSKQLKVPKMRISIISGERGRHKRIQFDAISPEVLDLRLHNLLS